MREHDEERILLGYSLGYGSESGRREAARYLRGLFAPGEIVELARESHRTGW